MRWYSKFKRYRTKNFFKTKESFNLVNTNLLSFILPLFIHLSLFSYETRYVWMTSYIILAFYILYKDWKCLGTGLLAIILYLCLVLPTIVKPLLDDGLYIIKGTVVKLGTNYFIISNSKHNVLVYSNNSVSASSIVQGSLVEVKGNLNKNLSDIKFDKSFVLSNSIKYVVNNPIVNKVTYQTNSLSKIINAYGSNKIYFARYWSTMVFGINDSQIANVKARLINVLHLIVISGLHFDLLFYFIVFLAKKIFKKQTKTLYFVFMILFCYITLLNSFVSAIRSLIMLIIKHQKKNWQLQIQILWWVSSFTNSYICNKLRLDFFTIIHSFL
ncbi:MAG0480 family ComEC-like protein [Mycoplasmopsis bovis]|uniref:MAG0480 family ComEC-like protein n=1 Tax=Mycoplasmopsis bovis TaxID=28903 RepID=UPI0032EBFFC6